LILARVICAIGSCLIDELPIVTFFIFVTAIATLNMATLAADLNNALRSQSFSGE
jgi:hypothetical protein